MATSNFCGGAGRAEKGLDIVLRWCFVCRGCCAGAVDGLCYKESFRGSRRWRVGATGVKGVSMRVSGSRRWRRRHTREGVSMACRWVAPMASRRHIGTCGVDAIEAMKGHKKDAERQTAPCRRGTPAP